MLYIMTFGERIKAARVHSGLSVPFLATRIGVSKQMFYRWEKDETKDLMSAHLLDLAKETGVNAQWLGKERGSMTSRHLDDVTEEILDIFASVSDGKKAEILDFVKFKATGT